MPYGELLNGLQTRLVQEIGGEARRIDALITAGQQSFVVTPDPG